MPLRDRKRWDHRAGATLDYTVDWTLELEDEDYIVATTFVIVDSSLSEVSFNVWEQRMATVWASGAIAGRLYDVINQVTTHMGRQDFRVFQLLGKAA